MIIVPGKLYQLLNMSPHNIWADMVEYKNGKYVKILTELSPFLMKDNITLLFLNEHFVYYGRTDFNIKMNIFLNKNRMLAISKLEQKYTKLVQ